MPQPGTALTPSTGLTASAVLPRGTVPRQRTGAAEELTGIASLAVRDLLNGPRREGRVMATVRGTVFVEFPSAAYEPRVIAVCGPDATRLPNAIIAIRGTEAGTANGASGASSGNGYSGASTANGYSATGTGSGYSGASSGNGASGASSAPLAPLALPAELTAPASVADIIVGAANPRPLRGRQRQPVVYAGGGMLRIGSLTIKARRWWDPSPVVGPLSRTRLDQGATALGKILADGELRTAARPTLATHADVKALAACCASGDLGGAVEHGEVLVGLGLGPGIIPGGDGVLCGMLLALRLLGGAIPGGTRAVWLADWLSAGVTSYARQRTTPLAAALLHCAARGQAAAEVAAVLHGMAGEEPIEPAARQLLAVSACDSAPAHADLAWGLVAGCRAAQVLSVS